MPSVTIITPTADQPIGMALLERYMARQTVQPDQWIVADDGDVPATLTMEQDHLVAKREHDGGASLASNMLRALEAVRGDVVVICEHDDYYAPDHIQGCLEGLQDASATGAKTIRYYNVAVRGFRVMQNGAGSALCQTAFRADEIPTMTEAANVCMKSGVISLDYQFWIRARAKNIHQKDTVVGIKGLPGRTGLGVGHRSSGFSPDPGMEKLREWVGEDSVRLYEAL